MPSEDVSIKSLHKHNVYEVKGTQSDCGVSVLSFSFLPVQEGCLISLPGARVSL